MHSFSDANANRDWKLNEWKPSINADTKLRPHYKGYHLAKIQHASSWFGEENYIAEAAGEIVEGYDCEVARQARIVEQLQLQPYEWMDVSLKYAEEIKDLLTIMQFPWDMQRRIHDAFLFSSKWIQEGLLNENSREMAQKYCSRAFEVASRNLRDSGASYQFMFNSEAAEKTARAISLLGHLNPKQTIQAQIDNIRITREISFLSAKAAYCSVEQLSMFDATDGRENHTYKELDQRQLSWLRASQLNSSASQAQHALSGIRTIQSDILLEKWGISHLKQTP